MKARRAAAVHGVRGFTLMELLVTVTIVAILAAVAIPSYIQYVERGKRAAARSALLEAASFLERSYTTNGNYTTQALPDPLKRAPSEGRQSYAITLSATAQTYTLTATPCGETSGCATGSDPFKDDKCGALTLTQAGVRGAKSGADLSVCWQR